MSVLNREEASSCDWQRVEAAQGNLQAHNNDCKAASGFLNNQKILLKPRLYRGIVGQGFLMERVVGPLTRDGAVNLGFFPQRVP